MKLPKKISPNPLVTSTVEIRFISTTSSEEILNIVYKSLSKELPNLKHKGIPPNVKNQQPEFKFLPDFSLYNDNFSFSFSDNVFVFENRGEYPLWDRYFGFIKSVLSGLVGKIHLNTILRIGVRYASVFEKKERLMDIISSPPSLFLDYDINEIKNTYHRTELHKNNIRLLLQLADRAEITRSDKKLSGVLIDIDSSSESQIPQSFNEDFYSLINMLHHEQKKLFFSLINEAFLLTLKPEY